MLLSYIKKNNINITGIIHIGANDCIEYSDYKEITDNIIWIEGNPEIVENVKKTNQNINIYQALITDVDDVIQEFNISNNSSQSSSILEFNLHKLNHPTINFINKLYLKSITINKFIIDNNINIENINALVLDIQGVELRALKGATTLLPHIKIIYTEVNIDETYTDCDKLEDIDKFLNLYGFKRIYTNIWPGHTYGDAIYLLNNL